MQLRCIVNGMERISDGEFSLFYRHVLDKAKEHSISGPELPIKRRVPKRFEEGSSQWSHSESPEDFYR